MKIFNIKYFFKNRRLISLINAFLGLFLMIATLVFIRDVISFSFNHKKNAVMNEKKGQRETRRNLQDYAITLKNNPFGFPAGELKRISGRMVAVSGKDVSLVGTVSGQKSLSYAIFMNKNGDQEGFRIGDSVFGLGILNNVEKDKIFIGAGENSMEIPLADIVSVREIRKTYRPKTISSGFSRKLSDGMYSIDQRKIQQAIANPKELMTDARLLPNIIDGRQQGFVMNEIKPGGIYESLGLRNGDVLLRINEFDISNPEYALQAFTALRGMERVQLDILRNGSRMSLTYQIK